MNVDNQRPIGLQQSSPFPQRYTRAADDNLYVWFQYRLLLVIAFLSGIGQWTLLRAIAPVQLFGLSFNYLDIAVIICLALHGTRALILGPRAQSKGRIQLRQADPVAILLIAWLIYMLFVPTLQGILAEPVGGVDRVLRFWRGPLALLLFFPARYVLQSNEQWWAVWLAMCLGTAANSLRPIFSTLGIIPADSVLWVYTEFASEMRGNAFEGTGPVLSLVSLPFLITAPRLGQIGRAHV